MKQIPNLKELLSRAKERHIFGTKMRSVIKLANEDGIREIVEQQFAVGMLIVKRGLIPILSRKSISTVRKKKQAEKILKRELLQSSDRVPEDTRLCFKLTASNAKLAVTVT